MDVGRQFGLERLEGIEPAATVEFVLHMPEEALHAGVVQAGRLAGHALGDAEIRELSLVAQLLVLPALVRIVGDNLKMNMLA